MPDIPQVSRQISFGVKTRKAEVRGSSFELALGNYSCRPPKENVSNLVSNPVTIALELQHIKQWPLMKTAVSQNSSKIIQKIIDTYPCIWDSASTHRNNNTSYMRTKTLLLTAALTAAGVASSMAQVYSINAVGYVNKPIPTGFSIIANPLTATPPSANELKNLIPAPPAGTTIYLFRGGNFVIATFQLDDNDVLNWTSSPVLLPGEGAFALNPGSPFTVTFVGEVSQSTAGPLVNPLPSGFSLRASMVPQSGQLDTVLGYPVQLGDTIYRYDNSIANYLISTYQLDDNDVPNWTSIPVPGVGEGFWVSTSTARNWSRSFTVN